MTKEVSCIALKPVFEALRIRHLPVDILRRGVPYDLAYLSNNHERIEWDAYCTIMENLRQYFSDEDFEQLGAQAIKLPMFHVTAIIGRLIAKPPELYVWFMGRPEGPGMQWFGCILPSAKIVGENHVIVSLELPPGHKVCKEFFLTTKGSIIAGPRVLGLGPSIVTMHPTERGATYDILCPPGGGSLAWIRKVFTWPLSVRRAARELYETNEALLKRYAQLEELQQKSERQALRLKAANEIGRLIHSNLDLDSTLSAIVRSLVQVGPFSAATILLDQAVEGEFVNHFMKEGEELPREPAISSGLESHGRRIGELNVWLSPGSNPNDARELLNDVLPTITAEVDDAISFKIVNDYRDSLKQKVEERTRELKEINEALTRSQAGRDRLFSNISHEFRTPLTLILGPLEEILAQEQERKSLKLHRTMKRQVEKLLGLINQLLELSRLQSGDVKLRAWESDFVLFLRGVVMTYRSLADAQHIRLSFQSDRGSCHLFFDAEKAEILFNNLLLNAFKFTPDGGKIDIRVETRESDVQVRVRDSGPGIPENEMEHIFERFYQGAANGSHGIGGTGIGLALTKELTELHHGFVHVQSTLGRGTEFVITLPLGRAHLRDEELASSSPNLPPKASRFPRGAPVARGTPRPPSARHGRRTVLVIDDDAEVRQYVKRILVADAIVVEAGNGDQGIRRARAMMPDLILCDVMMPAPDGYQVCRILKSDVRTSHIPIILLTAKAGSDSRIEGLEKGADDYVIKPFIAKELLARIRNLIVSREYLRKKFSIEHLMKPGEIQVPSAEAAFIQKARDIVERHISDESYSIGDFSREIGLSRTQLHRKLVALTDQSARDFLRSIRLQRARDLLLKNAATVSEIAYQSGFRDPSHFAKHFRRQFGISPRAFRQSTGGLRDRRISPVVHLPASRPNGLPNK